MKGVVAMDKPGIMIFTGSPNKAGLTAACGEQARMGVEAAGGRGVVVSLNELNIGRCLACNDGWGTCRNEHKCQVEDGFQKIHTEAVGMKGFVFITPVYWWDMSESMKAFTDRLRRCEAMKKDNYILNGVPVLCVAAAGGSGNGFISCLANMEKFVDHLKGTKHDLIGVTRRNKDYKLKTIYEAARAMLPR